MRAVFLSILLVVLLLACFSAPASAESPQREEEAQGPCDGCVLLNAQQVEEHRIALAELLRRAYAAGRKYERESCRNAI